MDLEVGQIAPDFTLPDASGTTIRLSQFLGKKVILYFYPKDNTPGCTDEARAFRDVYGRFAKENTVVIGISRDSVASHQKFAMKHELSFSLLSDAEGIVVSLYGVLKEKNMYGKKTIGIERSTFIIDEQGIIQHIFRKVKVAGHAQSVCELVIEHK